VRVAPVNVGNSTYWKYEYSMKDHTSTHFGSAQCQSLSTGLGNIRVVFAAHSHGQPELLQQTSYYPGACPEQFGRMTLQQQNFYSQNATENKYLYNSKELQDDQLAGNTLEWYDYGARFYDATLGRWHVVDPLAEDYSSWSPYNYVMNNPLKYIDPDGMRVWPGEGTINAKNAGKIGDKTLSQVHNMQGKQAAKAIKYTSILLSFGKTAGLILAPTTLGLSIVKDALPENEKAQNTINNPGGIPGLVVDGITGENQTLLKEAGELILGVSTLSNPFDALNLAVDATKAIGNEVAIRNSTKTKTDDAETSIDSLTKGQNNDN
jgi:RHS repeat-associated protein